MATQASVFGVQARGWRRGMSVAVNTTPRALTAASVNPSTMIDLGDAPLLMAHTNVSVSNPFIDSALYCSWLVSGRNCVLSLMENFPGC